MEYYIGTSGWHYDHWRERFYPGDLPKSRWLDFYSKQFSTVELNNSFYRLPSENAFSNWKESTPADFVFSVKVSRFITHVKRLKDSAGPVDNFVSRARLLEQKLGEAVKGILWTRWGGLFNLNPAVNALFDFIAQPAKRINIALFGPKMGCLRLEMV